MLRKSNERDLRDLSDFLNRWNSMTMIEKENYVIKHETEIESSRFWEDLTDDEGDGEYYPGQKEYLAEYFEIKSTMKKVGRLN